MKKKHWIILGLVIAGTAIIIWKRDKIFKKIVKIEDDEEKELFAQGDSSTNPCPDTWNGYICTGKWKRNDRGVCYCHNGDLVPQSWMKNKTINR